MKTYTYHEKAHLRGGVHLGANGYRRNKARCGFVSVHYMPEVDEFADDGIWPRTSRCDRCIDLLTDFEYINGVEV